MLTKKQSKLLDYLIDTLKKNRVSPSFEEMRINLGLSSKSGVHRLITGLEERGFIKRLHNKARAIKILKDEERDLYNFEAKKINSYISNSIDVHIYGKISAGTPIEAIQQSEGNLSVPNSMIKKWIAGPLE